MSVRVIDLFAGFGGFSEAAKRAGLDVVWAANHNELAVRAHQLNHPGTEHVCQDLRQADWSKLPEYDLLLASPACQGHSQAAQPSRARSERVRRYHDELRATAACVVTCAHITQPKAIIIENTPDFCRWGPDGNPGALYQWWLDGLRILGYHVQELRLMASRMGAPQRRERLFVVATRRAVELDLKIDDTEMPFGPCIESNPAGARWKKVKTATPAVFDRIAKGRGNCGRTFLTQHVSGHPGVPLDEPIRTITTKDQWALVDGAWYRGLTIREYCRAMGFSDDCVWPKIGKKSAVRLFGNAVCPPVGKRLISSVVEAAALQEAA